MLPLALQHQATALLDRDRFDLALPRPRRDTGSPWTPARPGHQLAPWQQWPWSRPSGDAARRRVITPGSCSRWDANAKPPTSSASPNGGSACCPSPRAARTRPPANLLAATAAETPESHPMIALRAVPDAVEAAVRAGRQPEIAARFARYQEWANPRRGTQRAVQPVARPAGTRLRRRALPPGTGRARGAAAVAAGPHRAALRPVAAPGAPPPASPRAPARGG
jgi:hypothetical protein